MREKKVKIATFHRSLINPLIEPKTEEKFHLPNPGFLARKIAEGYIITIYERDEIITIEGYKKLKKTK